MSESLERLRAGLRGIVPPCTFPEGPGFDAAVERFIRARGASGSFGPDEAVLLRQALLWSKKPHLSLRCRPGEAGIPDGLLEKSGIEWDPSGEARARPFRPEWMSDNDGIDAAPELLAAGESFSAEPYLRSVSYSRWRSQAQKEAAWFTLTAPPGRTRLVVLPTGGGKSLCFQLLARFDPALTVVIVPTIALALDQQSSASARLGGLPGINPISFASDQDADAVVQMVSDQKTRLLFASPEACVSGRLRGVLDRLAKCGAFANLVIDEAHMIETWGAQFRVEFQVLSAARLNWLKANPALRTFLFSATMSPSCRELLREMFSPEGPAEEMLSQRLRPEIKYYSPGFVAEASRDDRVVEAVWRLPRPAIVYTTEVDRSEELFARLCAEGFQRIGLFTGRTSSSERRDLLRRWKSDEIDLIIGTSAFGIGVDKPDVRTVVHACFPENLDRYYQEVGRGGRDGFSSISLLMPTRRDKDIAERLETKLLRPETIQKRWESMFSRSQRLPDKGANVYSLPMDAKPPSLYAKRTYSQNDKWNKRLLLQLQRAGLLEFLDLRHVRPAQTAGGTGPQAPAKGEEWASVEVRFPPHSPSVGALIEEQRAKELAQFRVGHAKLQEFLDGRICGARIIANVYGVPSEQRPCGGCPFCRRTGRAVAMCQPLQYALMSLKIIPPLTEMLAGAPSPLTRQGRGEIAQLIYRCVTEKGIRRFYAGDAHFKAVSACFEEALGQSSLLPYRLDRLPVPAEAGLLEPVVVIHVNALEHAAIVALRGKRAAHMFCTVGSLLDGEGRPISVNEKAREFLDPDPWLRETRLAQQ